MGNLPVEPLPRRNGGCSSGGVVSCGTVLSVGLLATISGFEGSGFEGERSSLRDPESSSESAMTWRGAMV